MATRIRFIELQLENFTCHRSYSLAYGSLTELRGKNGQGKTSIGTAPVWILWGIDLLGRKFDPSPVNYQHDHVIASLVLQVNDKMRKFTREIIGGKNAFYMNDVPVKAKEYEEAVAELFDKDEFMSFYYPPYFFGLHWTKQRDIVMRSTLPPARADVLKKLPELQAQELGILLKKHSLDDLELVHKDKKNKLEEMHQQAKGYTKAKREQLERARSVQGTIETHQASIAELEAKISNVEREIAEAGTTNLRIIALQQEIKVLIERRDSMKEQFTALKEERIEDPCRVCGQALLGESVAAAQADKDRRIAEFKAEYDRIVAERKAAEEELATLEYIDVNNLLAQLQKLRELKSQAQEAIKALEQRDTAEAELTEAENAEFTALSGLKESTFILDSIKAYRAKEAELQAEKVQALFTTLSIRLFDHKKNGEIDPAFVIQMDGKDYGMLSAGEKIAAGLELTEVLHKQSELITPVFIDNIESYTGDVAIYDQLITGRAVPDLELTTVLDY